MNEMPHHRHAANNNSFLKNGYCRISGPIEPQRKKWRRNPESECGVAEDSTRYDKMHFTKFMPPLPYLFAPVIWWIFHDYEGVRGFQDGARGTGGIAINAYP
jgi:hypothetical protein